MRQCTMSLSSAFASPPRTVHFQIPSTGSAIVLYPCVVVLIGLVDPAGLEPAMRAHPTWWARVTSRRTIPIDLASRAALARRGRLILVHVYVDRTAVRRSAQ